jgi:chitodextrinase
MVNAPPATPASPIASDFKLLSNSPAINTGFSGSWVTTDGRGVTRPQGGAYDIGAYEYGSGTITDTQAPSVPTGLTASAISSSQINLGWNASTDNIGVAGYKIYRNGSTTPIGETAATVRTYSNTGLASSTPYSYKVAAYDIKGNISAQSASASATTFPAATTAAPSLSLNTTSVAPGKTFTVTVNGASGDPVQRVGLYVSGAPDSGWSYEANWKYLNGSKTTMPSSKTAMPVTLTFTAPAAAGKYNLRLFSDTSCCSLLATSADITVAVPVITPSLTLNTTSVVPNGTFTVTVNGGTGTTIQRVGLYLSTGADADWSYKENWKYLNGSKTEPATAIATPVTLTFTAPAEAGTYNLRFFSDTGCCNPLAVSANLAVAVPLPDVTVTAITYAGGKFTATVMNRGTVATPVGKTIGVVYFVDGQYKTYGAVAGPLAAGAALTIGTNGSSYAIPSGTHTITATADNVNSFTEVSVSNNQMSKSIAVP